MSARWTGYRAEGTEEAFTMSHARSFRCLALGAAAALLLGLVPSVAMAGDATHYQITGPKLATVGANIPFTVDALDVSGDLDTSYSGSVDVSSTDGSAFYPTDPVGFSGGVATFDVMFETEDSETVTVTDHVSSLGDATSDSIAVLPDSDPTHLVVSASGSPAVGAAVDVTVTAENDLGGQIAGYTDKVHFSSTDLSPRYLTTTRSRPATALTTDPTSSSQGSPSRPPVHKPSLSRTWTTR